MRPPCSVGKFLQLILFSFPLGVPGCGCDRHQPAAPPTESASADKPAVSTSQPKAPLVPKVEIVDWCKEHGVPESICTRCNPALIAEFKKKGDWCSEHNLPESQCVPCHPELAEKFKAMAPKKEP